MDKIIKLLNLSGSDNDNEALAAIRMANKRLAEKGLTWEAAIEPKLRSLAGGDYKPNYKPKPNDTHTALMEIFDIVLAASYGKSGEFVESLYKQYKRTGRLSEKQLAILMKIYHQK